MRVYFAPCGIGLGHVGRCLPIAEELKKRGGCSLFSAYGQGVAYIKERGFHAEHAYPVGFAVSYDGTVDFRWSLVSPGPRFIPILLNQLSREIRLIETYRPDIVVADTRVTPIIAARLLGVPSIVILNQYWVIVPRRRRFFNLAKIVDGFNLTVIGWLWSLPDYTVITDFPEPYTLSIANLRVPSSRLRNLELVGPVVPVRPEDLEGREKLRRKFGVVGRRKIVFAAISGPIGEKRYLIDLLLKILPRFPKEYAVFMSMGVPEGGSEPIRDGNLTIIPWLENRFELMKASDVIISRAGHGTLSQAMYFGKPAVVIPTPNHTEQFGNAWRASTLGFARVLRQEDLTLRNLLECVDCLSNSGEQLQRAEEIRSKVANLNAIESILEIMFDIAGGSSER